MNSELKDLNLISIVQLYITVMLHDFASNFTLISYNSHITFMYTGKWYIINVELLS